MTLVRRARSTVAAMALFAMVAALAIAPDSANAADHLDAPGLTSPSGMAQLDINDLYVFEGATGNRTVLALTVNPVAAGDSKFINWKKGAYHVRIDNDGDAKEDITYSVSFVGKRNSDRQYVIVRRAEGTQARRKRPGGKLVGFGVTDKNFRLFRQRGMGFAGLRSDPFFFDLGGFLGTVEGSGTRMFNDGNENDFFEELNTLGIVLEMPDKELGDQINVWATTSGRSDGTNWQVDRIGRPAINTVVNSSGPIVGAPTENKNVYNMGKPKNDVSDFTAAVISALQAYSSLDTEGAYTDANAGALAAVLLPDVIAYDTSTAAAGPLNGRGLADDVIDIELTIVTGGDPLGLFPSRDASGAINGDGIGPHTDYLSMFPYLGVPNT